MSFPANLYTIAAAAAERLLFSLGIGTLLALAVWLLLRVFPKKDSRTSFAAWFATLLITAALPALSWCFSASHRGSGTAEAVITISASWAVYIFLGWAAVACLGLARVAAALWQVQKLQTGSEALDAGALAPELRELAERFRQSRGVELRVSRRLEVPTAVGFCKPAILLPQWLLAETPAEELRYILLHEFEHLRRRDDWTNLAQQMVKALLFFLPSVWWIERKLALEREMACDDAVLEQSGTPRGYAECLARVAERSFLRRQLALAQAAVSKLRPLSLRVKRILDPNRQQPARRWKPAVPAVVVVAGLCAFSASQAPSVIGFADGMPMMAAQPATGATQEAGAGSLAHRPLNAQAARSRMAAQTGMDAPAKVVTANFQETSLGEPAGKLRAWDAALKTAAQKKAHAVRLPLQKRPSRRSVPELRAANPRNQEILPAASNLQPSYVTVREEFVMVVAQQASGGASWQMHVVEISVMQAKPQKQIPKKI